LVTPGWDSTTSDSSASSTFMVIRTVCMRPYYRYVSAEQPARGSLHLDPRHTWPRVRRALCSTPFRSL
jgi:hypothetical protein